MRHRQRILAIKRSVAIRGVGVRRIKQYPGQAMPPRHGIACDSGPITAAHTDVAQSGLKRIKQATLPHRRRAGACRTPIPASPTCGSLRWTPSPHRRRAGACGGHPSPHFRRAGSESEACAPRTSPTRSTGRSPNPPARDLCIEVVGLCEHPSLCAGSPRTSHRRACKSASLTGQSHHFATASGSVLHGSPKFRDMAIKVVHRLDPGLGRTGK